MTTVTLSGKDASGVAADALVLATAAATETGGPATLLGGDLLPAGARRALEAALPVLGVKGTADEVVRVPSPDGVRAAVVVLSGTGRPGREGTTTEALRRAAGAATRSLAGSAHAVLALPTDGPDLAGVVEGALLGAYSYTEYRRRSASPSQTPVERLTVHTARTRDKAAKAVVERAHVLAAAVSGTKDLVNCPPVDLYPARFAEIAQALGKEHGVKVSVLDEAALRTGGYGGLVGVGQGSTRGAAAGEGLLRPVGSPQAGPPGAGRQGHHVRLRRPVDQARRGHGDDEARHGRRRRRAAHGGRRRAAGAAGGRHRLAVPGREHAVGLGAAPVRRHHRSTAGAPSRCSTPTPRAASCSPTAWSPRARSSPTSSSTSPPSPAPRWWRSATG